MKITFTYSRSVWLSFYMLILLGLLPILGMSQAAGYGQTSAYEQLEQNFCGSALSEERLEVFGNRAKQKAEDFIDYMRIIQDQQYDDEMRAYAAEEVKALFVGDVGMMTDIRDTAGELADNALYAFLAAALENKVAFPIEQNGFFLSEPFSLAAESMTAYGATTEYRGVLWQPIVGDGKGYQNAGQKNQYIEVILKKVKKQFGKEEKEVWEVVLGDISVGEGKGY